MVFCMTDRLILKNLTVYAYHGVGESEKKLGQRFEIDVTASSDFSAFVQDDSYADAVCYAQMAEVVMNVATSHSYNLIETLGVNIAEKLLATFSPLKSVTVTVRKPSAPIPHALDYAAIETTRTRD